MGDKRIIAELMVIQQKLNAPKGQFNKFGGYHYRSCEDILSAVKPLLDETNTVLTIQDEIVGVEGRVYVKATATLTNVDGESFSVSAFAREAETKKGMDEAQITGAASSYARKYALNGLFAIDDTKDADATNDHGKKPVQERSGGSRSNGKAQTNTIPPVERLRSFTAIINDSPNLEHLSNWWKEHWPEIQGLPETMFNDLVRVKDAKKKAFVEGKQEQDPASGDLPF